MKLHEFKILQRQPCTRNHSITIARARVRARAAKVSPSISASGKDGFVCTEAVEGTIFHVEGNNTDALAILHYKVERKVFDEKVRIVTQGLAIEGMQQCMTSTVSRSGAAVSLSTLSVLQ